MRPMRIAVVSDTHLPRFGRALPRALVEGITRAGVDLIVHCGDFTGPEVPALFEALGPFDAVAGNNDGPELVARFGRRKVVDAGGARLGLVHGDLGAGSTTPLRAAAAFGADEVDAVLFGHSHIPLVERLADGRWLVNPGSPTDRRRQPRYSWALVEITPDDGVRPALRYFDDRSA
jgi:putative phosphoesterase